MDSSPTTAPVAEVAPDTPGTLDVLVTPQPGKIYSFMGIFIGRYVKELKTKATAVDVNADQAYDGDPPRFRLHVENVTPSEILAIRTRLAELGFHVAEVALTA